MGPPVSIPPDQDSAVILAGGKEVRVTNLRKVFWVALGLTKGDLLQYYADVAHALLPHLRDRAMVMKRYPHGASGDFFFMKRAPSPRPSWIEICRIDHGHGNVIDFPMIQDEAALMWVINLGCIDLNQWYATCDDTNRPDYLHFDLDPGAGATFEVAIPLPASDADEPKAFAAPALGGQSVMLVAPQTIETSLIARRLERWGAQTRLVSDAAVALALLPERVWHAVLIDRALGLEAVEALAEAARAHARERIVMFTPGTRQEPKPSSPLTGYLVKPLRAASLAARLSATPEVTPPALATDATTETMEPIQAATGKPVRGLAVLVAEDNEINALLIGALLARLGHHAVIATNGEIALESWLAAQSAGAPYDLVLMDIQMPELDGIETARRIRASEAGELTRRTPILALTANTLVQDRYDCFESGMDGFLIKPVDRDKLAKALSRLAAARLIAA